MHFFAVKKMGSFDFFNVLVALVREEVCSDDTAFMLKILDASITESVDFSERLRDKIIYAIGLMKEWQKKGNFGGDATAFLHETFDPNNLEAQEELPPEERLLRHLIGLGILHLWTVDKEDVSSYKKKVEELNNHLSQKVDWHMDPEIEEEGMKKLEDFREKLIEF